MTIDFSFLTEITNELERVRAIEALCHIGLTLTKDQPYVFQTNNRVQELFGMISLLNIAVLPVRLDAFRPMINRLQIED